MGILASLGFLIVIFTIGFRYNNWTLSFLISLLTGGFAFLLAMSNIEEIKKQWNDRRCDLEIMLTAQLYKPDSDPRTPGEFATENFQFCIRSIFTTILITALAPVLKLVNSQLSVLESVTEMLDRLRNIQAIFMKHFTGLMDPFFNRFKTTGSAFATTYMKFLSAMGRAFGITQAVMYIGMSLVIGVENFVEFIIRVVMIVMYIILGLMILLFFLILPVLGLILYTCYIIGSSPFGYLAKDVCGEICFDPQTRVKLQDGTVKWMDALLLGDVLEDGSLVEGILEVSAEQEPVYVLDGIRVSGAHLVWFEEEEEWIPVAEHPEALLSHQRCSRLLCLRTNSRTIPLEGLSKTWSFRDWEELPTNLPTSDTIWDFLVGEILNEKAPRQPVPKEIPLLRETCHVMYKTGEIRRISEVRIGDILYGSEGFTKVTGVYRGTAEFQSNSDFTDGLWLRQLPTSDWVHPEGLQGSSEIHQGYHLTTESGCFWIQTSRFSGFVRDFTEVGIHNLPLTYKYTRELLKKSFSREESCVSVSLSQVLLSCSQPIF